MPSSPDNDPPNDLSEYDLDFNSSKTTPSPLPNLSAENDIAAPDVSFPESRLLRILTPWKMLIVLTGCMLFSGARNIDSKEDSAQSESIERVMTAISSTKEAFADQPILAAASKRQDKIDLHPAFRQNTSTERFRVRAAAVRQHAAENSLNRAINDWRKVVASKSAHANDWRRLGITLGTFGRQGASEAFEKAVIVGSGNPESTSGRLARRSATKSLSELNQHPIPMDKERALWDNLYGSRVPTANEVPELSRQIKLLKLGWFERLAEYSLYSRVGDTKAAAQIRMAAVAAAESGGRITTFEVAIALLGLLMWIGLGIKAVVHKIDGVQTKLPEFQMSTLIDYQTGMVAFLLYFLTMTFIGLPVALLRRFVIHLAPVQLLRLEILLQLVLYVPILAITLIGMKAVCSIKRGSTISWRQLFFELGLRSESAILEILAGVRGFILILPIFLITSGLSQFIFSKFHTPMNPAQLEIFAVQNGWDRLVLILGVAVAGPIVEEILFRGVLFQTMLSRFRMVPSMLISGAVFALVHPTLPAGFLPIWILGSGFAMVFFRRNSLIANIVMHCLHNGLIIAAGFAMMAK